MAINFPNAPNDGDIFVSGSTSFRYDAAQDAWRKLPASNVIISDTAPSSNLLPGFLWWDSDTGRLSVYYDDGDSTQWVSVAPSTAGNAFTNDGSFVYYDGALNVGIGTATPAVKLDVVSTDAIRMPVGTDAQRPGSPANGMVRYNTDQASYEAYNTSSWQALGIPPGGIIMWSGSIVNIPDGWALCDGTNGTPNLQDRFIVGAGNAYAVGDTGGASTTTLTEAQLPSHTHTFSGTTGGDGGHNHTGTTSTIGDHTHPTYGGGLFYSNHNPGGPVAVGFGSGGSYFPMTPQANILGGGSHNHTFTTSTVSNHTHSFSGTTAATGSGSTIENRPPYYALAYIMKL